jgi:L-rhamnose mutarotase
MSSSSAPRRFGQIIKLRRSCLEEYKACHAAAWPDVLQQIKACHILDYSIFLDEASMTLFATLKYDGVDWEADMAAMRANPVVRRWWEMTDAMQETLVEGSAGSTDAKGWWKDLEEIFRVD